MITEELQYNVNISCRLGDLVNYWRVHTLDLEAVPATEGPGLLKTLRIPVTYCWSPSLVPKPLDWGDNIGKES